MLTQCVKRSVKPEQVKSGIMTSVLFLLTALADFMETKNQTRYR